MYGNTVDCAAVLLSLLEGILRVAVKTGTLP